MHFLCAWYIVIPPVPKEEHYTPITLKCNGMHTIEDLPHCQNQRLSKDFPHMLETQFSLFPLQCCLITCVLLPEKSNLAFTLKVFFDFNLLCVDDTV